VDWLQNVQHGDIGLISSHKKRLKKVGKGCGVNSGGNNHMARKTKVGGVCNARFELFYLFNYLIEFRVFLNNLFDLW